MSQKIKITQSELDIRLQFHRKWRNNEDGGQTLSLPEHDLSGLCFKHADISGANLTRCCLDDCDFSYANLVSINVTESSFISANFSHADLTSSDFKYIKLDETTLFTDCIYNGMMVDLPTADRLPEFMDQSIMQIIQEYSVKFNFNFPKQESAIARGILDDFTELIQTKFNNKVKVTQHRPSLQELELKVEAANKEELASIQHDIYNFGRLLKGEIEWNRITDDPELMSRLQLNAQVRQLQLELQKKQIAAISSRVLPQMDIVELAGMIAEQLKINVLPVGPTKNERADCNVTLPNGNKKSIKAEDVVFIKTIAKVEKDFRSPVLYMVDGSKIEVSDLFSDLIVKLAAVQPTIIMVHQSYIVNMLFVKTKVNEKNNYIITTKPYPNERIIVGQNHKSKFNEYVREYNIVLDAEEVA
jgi:Pentapeptide repeats (8 copies)